MCNYPEILYDIEYSKEKIPKIIQLLTLQTLKKKNEMLEILFEDISEECANYINQYRDMQWSPDLKYIIMFQILILSGAEYKDFRYIRYGHLINNSNYYDIPDFYDEEVEYYNELISSVEYKLWKINNYIQKSKFVYLKRFLPEDLVFEIQKFLI